MRGRFLYKKVMAVGVRFVPRLLCVAVLCVVQLASAQEALTLQEAGRRALQQSPELQVFQWRLRGLEGLRQSAALGAGFELGVEADNVLGSGEFSGTDRAEYTLSLSSVIELGGKRGARAAAAHSRYALAEVEREARALDLLAQVTQRYIAALALQEKLGVMAASVQLAEASLQVASDRVERGAAPEAERLRAQAGLAQSQLDYAAVQAAFASRRMALATLWGAESADFDALQGDLYASQPARDFDTLYSRVMHSPAFQVFATQARLRDAELELARSQSRSNVRWTLGFKRFEDSGDTALMAGVALPLFAPGRNQGKVTAAHAERQMVDVRQQVAQLSLRARLYEAWLVHQQANAATQKMRERVLPVLEEALRQTRSAYERGRYHYADLLSAQRELLDARLAMVEAASSALSSQALIEQLTAAPLADEPATGDQNSNKSLDLPVDKETDLATAAPGQTH